MSKRIVIDLFDGTEELDAVGPWQVLSYWTQAYPADGWRVDLVTNDGQPRRCAKGLQVVPTAAKAAVPRPDLIVEPGGRGTRARLADTDHLRWLCDAAESGARVSSVLHRGPGTCRSRAPARTPGYHPPRNFRRATRPRGDHHAMP